MSEAKATTDHETIKAWAEDRGGRPATVRRTGRKGEAGLLRLDFEDEDEELEPISWETFFEKFDQEDLVFLFQEETADGSISRFHKFVDRETADASAAE
jgi:hypothetical protein